LSSRTASQARSGESVEDSGSQGHLDYITSLLSESVNEARLLGIRGRVTQVTGTIIRAMVPAVGP